MTPNPNKDESTKKEKLYLPHSSVQKTSHVKSMKEYKEKYEESINNPDKFWTDFSKNFYFEKEHKGESLQQRNKAVVTRKTWKKACCKAYLQLGFLILYSV